MRDQLVVLAVNLGVVLIQAAVVAAARLVESARGRQGRVKGRMDRAYLASRRSRRKHGEQSGGRVPWTEPAGRPDLAGNATRWSSHAPLAR